MLSEILLQRFERYFNRSSSSLPFSLSLLKCFEDIGVQFLPREREDLAFLTQCIIYLVPFYAESQVVEMMICLLQQLSTPESFLKLTGLPENKVVNIGGMNFVVPNYLLLYIRCSTSSIRFT